MISILAETGLPDPQSFPAIGWVAVVLILLVWGINQVVELIQAVKPKPSYEEKFAAKVDHDRTAVDLEAHKRANTSVHSQLFARINEVERGVSISIQAARREIEEHGDKRKYEIIHEIREVKGAIEKDRDRLGKVELEVRENTGWIAATRERGD